MLSRLIDRLGIVRTAVVLLLASIAVSVAITTAIMALWFGYVDAAGVALSVMVPAVAAPPFLILQLRLVAQLRAAREELRRLSLIDPLSGAFNRRHLMAEAQAEVERARRNGEPFAVLMMDLDDFKHVNDRHGHVAGDHVIRAVADLCRGAIREKDVFARVGGDEFVVLLPRTDRARAAEVAETLRQAIATARIEWAGARVALGASVGIAAFGDGMTGVDDVLAAADRALLAAKRGGKNQTDAAPRVPQPA